jgi:hypothetical protein
VAARSAATHLLGFDLSKPIKLKLLFTTIQQLYSKKNQSGNES